MYSKQDDTCSVLDVIFIFKHNKINDLDNINIPLMYGM